jgi:peptidoglycan/xylan/chitin deacetylase (PgdA/CDA1 family)
MVIRKLKRLQQDAKVFFRIWEKTLVLMYHRIENESIDPWKLSVSPKNFEFQLKFLKNTGLVKPMEELVSQFNSKKELKPAIVITFDDGYEDNYLNAKPLLEKYGLPATFFITNKHIGEQKEFWWDELAHLTLEELILPERIEFQCMDKIFQFELKEEAVLNKDLLQLNKGWDGLNMAPTLRAELYLQLWKILSPMTYEDQQSVLEKFRNCIGVQAHKKVSNYCMSENQLASLAGNSLFTLGGHTNSHPLLPAHSLDYQEKEISLNKSYLQNYINYKINTFAYPSGKSNEDTVKALKGLGFEMAFNTIRRKVERQDDPFHIGRVQVMDWNEKEFEKRLGYLLI